MSALPFHFITRFFAALATTSLLCFFNFDKLSPISVLVGMSNEKQYKNSSNAALAKRPGELLEEVILEETDNYP